MSLEDGIKYIGCVPSGTELKSIGDEVMFLSSDGVRVIRDGKLEKVTSGSLPDGWEKHEVEFGVRFWTASGVNRHERRKNAKVFQ